MKFIEWSKKNYLIVILFIIVVLILAVKLNLFIKENNVDSLPTTPTILNNNTTPQPTKKIEITTFGNKTKEEILKMDPEERYEFTTELSREEVEELDMMPNYDFSGFLPYINENFIVEKFDYENKQLTVKPLIEDKNKIKEEVDAWLFYENGNNPKKIEIIWNE